MSETQCWTLQNEVI